MSSLIQWLGQPVHIPGYPTYSVGWFVIPTTIAIVLWSVQGALSWWLRRSDAKWYQRDVEAEKRERSGPFR
jgi:hypothetical protein